MRGAIAALLLPALLPLPVAGQAIAVATSADTLSVLARQHDGLEEQHLVAPPRDGAAGPEGCGEGEPATRALLIGADRSFPNMAFEGAGNDATLMRSALAARGAAPERLALMADGGAGLDAVAAEAARLVAATRCGDSVVVHLAGFALRAEEVVERDLAGRTPRPLDGAATLAAAAATLPVGAGLTGDDALLDLVARLGPWAVLDAGADGRVNLLGAVALSNLVTLLRNRGADVSVILDLPHARGFRLEALQAEADPGRDWRRPLWDRGPARRLAPQLLPLAPGAGALAVYYAADDGEFIPESMQLVDPTGAPQVHGHFSFRIAMAVMGAERTIPPALLRAAQAVEMNERRPTAAEFFATHPEVDLVAEARPAAAAPRSEPAGQGRIRIIDPVPTRGATVMETPRVTLRGVVEHPEPLLQVVVNGAFARREEGRRFVHDIELAPGANRINVVAVLQGGGVLVHETEIFLEGEAAALMGDGTRYAVMIANQNYRPGSGIPSLANPIGDAEAIAAVLRDRYGFVTETTGADGQPLGLILHDPTKGEIEDLLWEVGRIAGARDTVLVFYAGHGVFEQATGSAFWQPADARADRPQSWLSAAAITEALMRIEANNILLISDSCYSGMLSRSGEAAGPPAAGEERLRALQRLAERRSRILISSGANEPVYDGGGDGHSVFARALLDGLTRTEAPVFAAQELFADWLRPRVLGLAGQEPQFRPIERSGHEGGDVVFACTRC